MKTMAHLGKKMSHPCSLVTKTKASQDPETARTSRTYASLAAAQRRGIKEELRKEIRAMSDLSAPGRASNNDENKNGKLTMDSFF